MAKPSRNEEVSGKDNRIMIEKLPPGITSQTCSTCGSTATHLATFRGRKEFCCGNERCRIKTENNLKAYFKSLRFTPNKFATAGVS